MGACAKHFGFNQQETNRNSYSVSVDDKTAMELYFPPYQSSVDAGVASFMCSYNQYNGEHSCSSEKLLKTVLRDDMGFKGFVMSDWGATYDQADRGLDMDMPMTSDSWNPGAQTQEVVDTAALRIMASMYKVGVDSTTLCTPPNCEGTLRTNVTSAAHAELAKDAATSSIVLLSNDGVLPLGSAVRTIAVVGSASIADAYDSNGGAWNQGDYYSGGGSGHLTPSSEQLVKPLDGIKARAAQAGVTVLEATSDHAGSVSSVVKQADVGIIVCGATSTESSDRGSLSLDNRCDSLVSSLASTGVPIVVLMQVPGAILTPWRDQVSAAAVMFLGGQATGDAWARVLFGDVSPSARLPIELPSSESETIPPNSQSSISYTEGMQTSYRNIAHSPAFPFGHGLTFTNFSYSQPTVASCGANTCVSITVTNSGTFAARETPQLYLEFPSGAEYPTPILKGFEKTPLLSPGATAVVNFALSDRDMSYWNNGWVRATSFTAHIGASSGDIRIVHAFSSSSQLMV